MFGLFTVRGDLLGSIYGQRPSYLSERFPTDVRATATGFCYRQAAAWAGFAGPLLTARAIRRPDGFARPMRYAALGACVVLAISLMFGPETKGSVLVSDPQLAPER